MLIINTFGKPDLLNDETQEMLGCPPLSLLIAAYVAIEHQGCASTEQIYRLFLPDAPHPVEVFAPLANAVYAQLWHYGVTQGSQWNGRCRLLHEGVALDELQQAQQQLHTYKVIESVSQDKHAGLYEVTPRFKKQVSKLAHRSKEEIQERKRRSRKGFAQHIATVRKLLKEQGSEAQASACRNTGRELLIPLNSSITPLNAALAKQSLAEIKVYYQGAFLEDIENQIRTQVFLSPDLLAWLYEKRTYFAAQTSQALLQILITTAQQQEQLIEDIYQFCQQRGIHNRQLQTHLESLRQQPKAPPVLQPSNTHSLAAKRAVYSTFLPHLHQHLLERLSDAYAQQVTAEDPYILSNTANLRVLRNGKAASTGLVTDLHTADFINDLWQHSYGFAVLLGAAGMGKTWLLYAWARHLIQQAQQDDAAPLPLLLHLADFAKQRLCFADWLKQQLMRLGLPEKNIEHDFDYLFSYKRCVLLLDGFEHIPPSLRPNYLKALTYFIASQGESELGGLIIASRPAEYQAALAAAPCTPPCYAEIQLKPLDAASIQAYLQHTPTPWLDHPQLQALNALTHTPLGLKLLTQIEHLDTQDSEDLHMSVVGQYVQNCFQQAEQQQQDKPPFSQSQTRHYLHQLAQYLNPGESLYVEQLSPDILPAAQQKWYEWLFALLWGLVYGVCVGAVSGLIFGERVADFVTANTPAQVPAYLTNIHQALNNWSHYSDLDGKLALLLSYAALGGVLGVLLSLASRCCLKQRWHLPFFLGAYLIAFMGLTGYLMDGNRWASLVMLFYGVSGTLLGMALNPRHLDASQIHLRQDARLHVWQRLKEIRSAWGTAAILLVSSLLLVGLMGHLFSTATGFQYISHGLLFGSGFALSYLLYKASLYQDWQKELHYPAQKIRLVLQHSLFMTLVIGLSLSYLLSMLMLPNLNWTGSMSFGVRVGMLFGITLGFLFYGMAEVLKHLALRWVMYRQGIAPLRYVAFLEYAKQLGLLKLQGNGGYAFRHDWFQTYFMQKSNAHKYPAKLNSL